MHGTTKKAITRWTHTIAEWLIQPHVRLIGAEAQLQSRLLSMVLLALIICGAIIIAAILGLDPTDIGTPAVQGAIVIIGAALLAYITNRLGHFRFASVALVCVFSAVFMYTSFAPIKGVASTTVVFLFIPIMLAGIFFDLRGVLATAAIIIILGFALNSTEPESGLLFWTHRSLLYFLILASVLLITFILHLNNLERTRRAELAEANRLLRASVEQIQEINVGLEARVEERTRDLQVARDQAEAARQRAEEADQIKSQFLASMSHELRTPLNAILNFTKLMRKGMLGPVNDRQTETLNEVVNSGQHLLNLINDVLDISKMQSGMLNLFIEENIDLSPILDASISTTEALVKDKQVALVKDVDSDLPAILCDKRRVQQILLNLLSNAAKFTEQGTITLSAKRKGDDILFAIMDTSVGIPKDQHKTIFEPFVQTETGVKHAGGTGLGLPISKNLVEAHDGEIWLESTPGEGSIFKFTLPIESPRLRQQLESSMESAHAQT